MLEVIPLNRTGLLRADFKPIRLVDFRRTYLCEFSELSDKPDIYTILHFMPLKMKWFSDTCGAYKALLEPDLSENSVSFPTITTLEF